MIGGSMIEFSGLCLKPTDQIMCRFGSGDMTQTSYGSVLTGMKGRCVVPTLSERGIIEMSVSTNVGSTYSKSSTITIGKQLIFSAGLDKGCWLKVLLRRISIWFRLLRQDFFVLRSMYLPWLSECFCAR